MVYDITAVPVNIPVTIPPELTVAIEPLLVVQVPPGVALLSVVVVPRHTVLAPVIIAGVGLLFTVFVTIVHVPAE